MEQLLNKKPSNPEKYLIKILERRQSLLAEKPKTVRFDQWNPRTKTGRSQISEKFDVSDQASLGLFQIDLSQNRVWRSVDHCSIVMPP